VKFQDNLEKYFISVSKGGLAFHWSEGYLLCTNDQTYAPKRHQIRSLSPFRK
jgi:hypothetical protein